MFHLRVKEFIQSLLQINSTDANADDYQELSEIAKNTLELIFDIGISKYEFSQEEKNVIGPKLKEALPKLNYQVLWAKEDFDYEYPEDTLVTRSAIEFLVSDYQDFPAYRNEEGTLKEDLLNFQIGKGFKELTEELQVWKTLPDEFENWDYPIPQGVPSTHEWWNYRRGPCEEIPNRVLSFFGWREAREDDVIITITAFDNADSTSKLKVLCLDKEKNFENIKKSNLIRKDLNFNTRKEDIVKFEDDKETSKKSEKLKEEAIKVVCGDSSATKGPLKKHRTEGIKKRHFKAKNKQILKRCYAMKMKKEKKRKDETSPDFFVKAR